MTFGSDLDVGVVAHEFLEATLDEPNIHSDGQHPTTQINTVLGVFRAKG